MPLTVNRTRSASGRGVEADEGATVSGGEGAPLEHHQYTLANELQDPLPQGDYYYAELGD